MFVSSFISTLAVAVNLAPAPAADAPDPEADTATEPVAPPAPDSDALEVEDAPPFPSETLELSAVLERAVQTNIDLALNAEDVDINEARVLAALGAYDVFITAGVNGQLQEQPQRGSQFTFATGTRTLGGFAGFRRELETGGSIDLTINASRTLTDQPLNFLDPNAGSTTLASYRVAPTLTLTHPLLKGAGLRVNRAAINRAKIATSSSKAAQQLTAQNMVRDLVSAYWDVLFAWRDLQNKRQSVKLAEKQLERTQALVSAGRLAPVDAKSVEQSLAARESEVLIAENALLDASLTLRTLMGQNFARREQLGVVPATDPTVKPRPVDFNTEIEKSLAQNPQIRQLELALASRRIDELEAANNRLPQLDFQGSFTPQGRSVDTLPDASTGDPGSRGNWGEAFRNFFSDDIREDGLLADWTLSGSLTLTWDVQNRAGRGNHQAALGEIRKAQLNLEQVRQTVSTSVIRAANGLRTAAKRMEVAAISLELAEDNLAAEQARFDVGRSTNFDVLERLDERDTAAAEALNAQVEYLKALIQLQALSGEILPAYGIDVG